MSSIPSIETGLDEQRVGDEAVTALARCTDVFARRGQLVHVVDHTESGGGVQVARLPEALLRERLSRCAHWHEPAPDGGDPKPTRVPGWVVRAIAARGRWPGMQQLRAVVTNPVLRADGTPTAHAGYDAATGAFVHFVGRPVHVPSDPPASLVRRALADLRATAAGLGIRDEPSLAGWLAALMSAQARFAIGGPAPVFVFSPPTRTRGLDLATATGAIAHATPLESVDLDDLARRPDAAFTALRGDCGLTRIERFGLGDAHAQARVLDTLQTDRRARDSIWVATAEPQWLRPEVRARVVCIEALASAPRDEAGAGPVRLDRARVYQRALTVLVAHARRWSGADAADDLTFAAWTARIEDALAEVGLPRVLASAPPDDHDDADPRAVLLDAIERAKGPTTVRDLLAAIRVPRDDADRTLRDAIEALEPGVLAHPRAAQRMGFLLVRVAAQPVGARALVCLGSGMYGNRWTVRLAAPAP